LSIHNCAPHIKHFKFSHFSALYHSFLSHFYFSISLYIFFFDGIYHSTLSIRCCIQIFFLKYYVLVYRSLWFLTTIFMYFHAVNDFNLIKKSNNFILSNLFSQFYTIWSQLLVYYLFLIKWSIITSNLLL
jgi:hypothetical protein